MIRAPVAICPSGRRPLSNGIHAAIRTRPAAHIAALLPATAGPRRGSTSRDSSSQQISAQIKSGRRIQMLASLTCVIRASTL
ncbi:Uncharacterised protein [Mycobacteroides abscessus subsp. abscessus]|nr:Uncharacterised protein [Mycobacteroides abscessus subsp. abscessus]